MLRENSSEFLCHGWNNIHVAFVPLLFLCRQGVVPGELNGFDVSPVSSAVDTFILSCCASANTSLLDLRADSVAEGSG